MGRSMAEYAKGTLLAPTKWQVVAELGRGGMGIVLHVTKEPGIHAVAKIITRELAKRQEFRERFLQEVRIQASLIDKHIVRVTDYEELADGTPFFLMEKLNGNTLGRVMRERGKPLPAEVVHDLMTQLLEGLYAAHTHDPVVVHRDIKPENIFLAESGELKILDFGVARTLSHFVRETAVYGTLGWASPEQLVNGPITPQTDLYAAGLVMFYMIAGRGPFDKYKNEARVAQAHVEEEAPSIREFAPWVPQPIEELLRSALAKDPKDRPRDAYKFMSDLFALTWATDGTDGEGIVNPATTTPTVGTLATSVIIKHLEDNRNRSTVRGMTAPPVHGPTLENAPPEVQREIERYLSDANRGQRLNDTDVSGELDPTVASEDAPPTKRSFIASYVAKLSRVFGSARNSRHDGKTNVIREHEPRAAIDRKAKTSTLPTAKALPFAVEVTQPMHPAQQTQSSPGTSRSLPGVRISHRSNTKFIAEVVGSTAIIALCGAVSWFIVRDMWSAASRQSAGGSENPGARPNEAQVLPPLTPRTAQPSPAPATSASVPTIDVVDAKGPAR